MDAKTKGSQGAFIFILPGCFALSDNSNTSLLNLCRENVQNKPGEFIHLITSRGCACIYNPSPHHRFHRVPGCDLCCDPESPKVEWGVTFAYVGDSLAKANTAIFTQTVGGNTTIIKTSFSYPVVDGIATVA
jgi:hypothetical protein